jgi:hypothetical protein
MSATAAAAHGVPPVAGSDRPATGAAATRGCGWAWGWACGCGSTAGGGAAV